MADVSTPCSAYMECAEDWGLPRALMGGTKEMRKRTVDYLPLEPKESIQAYNNRLNRTTLYNAFGRAVRTLTGKLYTAPVNVDEDTPAQISDLFEDIDRQGRDLTRFMWDLTQDAMQTGVAHILVDYPPRPEGVTTQGQEKAANLRPYWVHIKAENLIGWRFAKVDGVPQLSQIRIRECAIEADGEWGEKSVERIRVLGIGTYEVYEKRDQNGKTEWVQIESGINTLKQIPLATVYTNRKEQLTGTPVLEDLARLNVAHWQSSSDQRAILHIARVPLLFATGLEEEEPGKVQEISASRMFKGPTGATLAYVEHTGKAIEAGQKDLDVMENQMAILAMEPMLQKQTGHSTATGKAIDTAEAHSLLQIIAKGIEDSIEQAMQFTGAWLNIQPKQCGGVEIECDFNLLSKDATDIVELGKANAGGKISDRAYAVELQRRGTLSEDFDFDKDQVELATQAPALGVAGRDASGGSALAGKMTCPDCHCVMAKGSVKCPDCGKDMTAMNITSK